MSKRGSVIEKPPRVGERIEVFFPGAGWFPGLVLAPPHGEPPPHADAVHVHYDDGSRIFDVIAPPYRWKLEDEISTLNSPAASDNVRP